MHIYVCVCTVVYVCMYVCVRVCVYLHAQDVRTSVYAHTHTFSSLSFAEALLFFSFAKWFWAKVVFFLISYGNIYLMKSFKKKIIKNTRQNKKTNQVHASQLEQRPSDYPPGDFKETPFLFFPSTSDFVFSAYFVLFFVFCCCFSILDFFCLVYLDLFECFSNAYLSSLISYNTLRE